MLFSVIEYSSFFAVRHNPSGDEQSTLEAYFPEHLED